MRKLLGHRIAYINLFLILVITFNLIVQIL